MLKGMLMGAMAGAVWGLVALALLVLGGCAVNTNGMRASLAMSTYTHREVAEDGSVWETTMARPWGTSSNEYYIDRDQESGSVTGEGLSNNMKETVTVVGETAQSAVGAKQAAEAAKVLVPAVGKAVVEATK